MFIPGIGFSRFTIQSAENIGPTYKTITINKTYVPSDQTNYVARIDASLFGSDFFTKLSSGGSARFTSSDGVTKLAHEKIFLNTGSSKGYYNVLIPTVNGTASGSSTSIRVYYENSLSEYPDNYTYGKNAVWANNYKFMQHLQTTPDQLQVNSVGNTSYDMTGLGGLTSGDVVTAFYGGGNAHLYDATGQGIKVSFCDITAYPFSIGLAFRTPTDALDQGYIAGITDTTSVSGMYGFYKSGLKSSRALSILNGLNGLTGSSTISNMESTTWNYAVAVYTSSTSRTLYFNAVTPATVTSSYAFSGNYGSTFIGYADFSTDLVFTDTGDLSAQDFFLMTSAMSADTYTTTYNNYTNGSFFTIT